MAKKKSKSTAKRTKSHGELFDKHPNLLWLLPIFLLIAAVAVIVYNNSMKPVVASDMLDADQIPPVNLESSNSAEEVPTY